MRAERRGDRHGRDQELDEGYQRFSPPSKYPISQIGIYILAGRACPPSRPAVPAYALAALHLPMAPPQLVRLPLPQRLALSLLVGLLGVSCSGPAPASGWSGSGSPSSTSPACCCCAGRCSFAGLLLRPGPHPGRAALGCGALLCAAAAAGPTRWPCHPSLCRGPAAGLRRAARGPGDGRAPGPPAAARPHRPARLHGLITLEGLAPGPLLARGRPAARPPALPSPGHGAALGGGPGAVRCRGALPQLEPLERGLGGARFRSEGAHAGCRHQLRPLRYPALAFLITLALVLLLGGLAAALWGCWPVRLSSRMAALRRLHASGWWPCGPPGAAGPAPPRRVLAGTAPLLLSTVGSVPGAGWFDVHVSLPLRTAAALLCLPWRW